MFDFELVEQTWTHAVAWYSANSSSAKTGYSVRSDDGDVTVLVPRCIHSPDSATMCRCRGNGKRASHACACGGARSVNGIITITGLHRVRKKVPLYFRL